MLRIKDSKWGNYLFDAWVVGFTALVVWSIIQIQHSRVKSCKDNYEAFNKVFKPFLHTTPTPEELRFRKTIRELKSHCGDQVHLWTY